VVISDSTNLQQFNRELDRATKKIKGDIQKFIKLVCLETFKRFIMRTAVQTGRARGNWQVEVNRAALGEVDESLWNRVFEIGAAKLAQIPPFSVIHITNNVEYVYYLEYVRRSKQHPEGMVEITLVEMKTWLAGIK